MCQDFCSTCAIRLCCENALAVRCQWEDVNRENRYIICQAHSVQNSNTYAQLSRWVSSFVLFDLMHLGNAVQSHAFPFSIALWFEVSGISYIRIPSQPQYFYSGRSVVWVCL